MPWATREITVPDLRGVVASSPEPEIIGHSMKYWQEHLMDWTLHLCDLGKLFNFSDLRSSTIKWV